MFVWLVQIPRFNPQHSLTRHSVAHLLSQHTEGVQGNYTLQNHYWLSSKFEAILGYIISYLKYRKIGSEEVKGKKESLWVHFLKPRLAYATSHSRPHTLMEFHFSSSSVQHSIHQCTAASLNFIICKTGLLISTSLHFQGCSVIISLLCVGTRENT